MQKRLISILKFGFFFGLGIFLVWWSIHKLPQDQYQKFITALKTADYILLIPVFFILSLSHLSRALRWKILMGSMGYTPKLSNTFCAVMVGYLANFAFPRLGEVLKCTILGKYEKVPADKLVGTILVERAVDLLSFGIVIIISLLTQAKIVGAYTMQMINRYFLSGDKIAVLTRFSIIAAILVLLFVILRYISKKYHHILIVDKIKGIIKGVAEGLMSIKKLKNKWQFIFHSVFIWCCYLGGTYLGFYATAGTEQMPALSTFPVLAFASIGMILTPGGIGAYAWFIKEVMIRYNIDEGIANANGILQWMAQTVIILTVGFICLTLLPYFNKKKSAAVPSQTL